MKKILIAIAATTLAAFPAFAGNLVEPAMEPEVVEAATNSSGGGLIIPILLLLLLAAAASSGGGGNNGGGNIGLD